MQDSLLDGYSIKGDFLNICAGLFISFHTQIQSAELVFFTLCVQELDEAQVIAAFLQAAKRPRP